MTIHLVIYEIGSYDEIRRYQKGFLNESNAKELLKNLEEWDKKLYQQIQDYIKSTPSGLIRGDEEFAKYKKFQHTLKHPYCHEWVAWETFYCYLDVLEIEDAENTLIKETN